ncbi:sulfite exporter TauE/SafE family protein [Thiorhodococcus fuscus]|uniref:Probable membrane transporter protein n=1 Tax=Thiorhodococcus fuscus TaxID=527200 RepID=A0ABW4YBX5_9GAMM
MSPIELSAYILIGAFSGLLAGLFGVGGGAVIVPALILVFGHIAIGGDWVPHLAVGTSLATIIGTGAASARAHHRRGGVRWELFAKLVPGIVIGVWIGAAVVSWIPADWLKRLFAVFLALVGSRMLLSQSKNAQTRPMPGMPGLLAAGGGIGLFSSLVGIGGGTLTVPFLNSRGIDMRQAVGTSAACGLPIAIAGAIGFVLAGWGREGLPPLATGFVYWPAVLGMLLASMPTAPWGARLAHRLPVKTLKRLFGVLLLLIATDLAFG